MPSSKIIHTKTGRQSATPHPDDLDFGELAINYNDGLLFYKNNSEKISILASNRLLSETSTHIGSEDNPHKVTQAQVGLEKVDNTPDIEKPISNDTAAALGTKVSKITLDNEFYNKVATNREINNKFTAIGIINADSNSVLPEGNLSYSAGTNTFTFTKTTLPTLSDLGGLAIDSVKLSVPLAQSREGKGTLSYNGLGVFTYDQPTISGLGGFAKSEIKLEQRQGNVNNDGTLSYDNGIFTYDKPTIGGLTDGNIRVVDDVLEVEGYAKLSDLSSSESNSDIVVDGLDDRITTNKNNIESNDEDITALDVRITTNKNNIESNDGDIDDLREQIESNDDDIAALKTATGGAAEQLEGLATIQNALSDLSDNKADQSDLTIHTSDTDNPHKVSVEQLNLDKVDNTSDTNKPISTDTQAALDLKLNISDLPDSSQTEINLSALTNAVEDKADQSDLTIHITANNPHGISKSTLNLDKVDNISDANKPISIATQAALDLKLDAADSILDGIGTNTQSINNLQSIVNTNRVSGNENANKLVLAGSPSSGENHAEIQLIADDSEYVNERNNAYYKAEKHKFTSTGTLTILELQSDGTVKSPRNTIARIEAAGDKAVATKEYVDSKVNGDLVARTYVDDQVRAVDNSLSQLGFNMSLVAPGGSYIAAQRYTIPTRSDGSAFAYNWTSGATYSSGGWSNGLISNGGFIFNSTGSARAQAVNSNGGAFAMVNNISQYKSMTINVGYQFIRNTDDGSSFYMQYSIKDTNNVFDVTPGGSIVTLSKAENVGGGWAGSQDQPTGWGVVHTNNSSVVVPPNSKIFFKFTAQINGGSNQYEGVGLRGFSITSPTWS